MLTFNLKKEWFDKIKSGEKTHEYRIYKPYWRKRFENFFATDLSATKLRFGDEIVIVPARYINFVCGYAPIEDTEKHLVAKVKTIRLRWGMETDLKIENIVYDIEFGLIKEQTNE
jgi:ASC-1-like (ASCH) protein